MVTGSTRGAPAHPLAWLAITTAVVAGVLGLYGSMHAEKHVAGSPLRDARGDAKTPPQPHFWVEVQYVSGESKVLGAPLDDRIRAFTSESKTANYSLQLVAFVLPFALGIGAGITGAHAMRAVQRSGGRWAGETMAVFAMLIGGLSAVTAACMMIALYVWPRVPALYTT